MTQSNWHDYFQPGETLLWEGAPLPGVKRPGRIALFALLGLPFLAFGVFGMLAGLRETYLAQSWNSLMLGLYFTTFSILFVGLGALLVFGQWMAAAEAHRTTRYAISTSAAYIYRSGWSQRLHSYPILHDTPIELERQEGYANLWFHSNAELDSDNDRIVTRTGFEWISDGEAALKALQFSKAGKS